MFRTCNFPKVTIVRHASGETRNKGIKKIGKKTFSNQRQDKETFLEVRWIKVWNGNVRKVAFKSSGKNQIKYSFNKDIGLADENGILHTYLCELFKFSGCLWHA